MSDFTHKENSGSAFKNDKKGNDKAPEYKGSINANGKVMDIALWIAEGKKGKYFSIKLSEPYTVAEITNNAAKQETPVMQGGKDGAVVDDSQDLPF